MLFFLGLCVPCLLPLHYRQLCNSVQQQPFFSNILIQGSVHPVPGPALEKVWEQYCQKQGNVNSYNAAQGSSDRK